MTVTENKNRNRNRSRNRARNRATGTGKGRRRALYSVVGVLAVVIVLVAVALLTPLLHVRDVEVKGTAQLSADEVVDASGLSEGENLLFTDTDAAASEVSGLPWVESVTVSRSWPSSVVVRVTEYEAVGYIDDDDGEPAVVNDAGKVFLRGSVPEGITEIDAEPDDTEAVSAAGTVLGALPDDVRGQVESVDAPSVDDITLRFPEGREVHWGSADRADEKAEATRVVLTREGQRWNVSNPAMPAVRS